MLVNYSVASASLALSVYVNGVGESGFLEGGIKLYTHFYAAPRKVALANLATNLLSLSVVISCTISHSVDGYRSHGFYEKSLVQ